jgi:hypothetical protein
VEIYVDEGKKLEGQFSHSLAESLVYDTIFINIIIIIVYKIHRRFFYMNLWFVEPSEPIEDSETVSKRKRKIWRKLTQTSFGDRLERILTMVYVVQSYWV